MKKIISFLLICCMVIPMMPLSVFASEAFNSPSNALEAERDMIVFAGGDGSKENPYQVSTPEQLDAVRYNLSAHYIQINDIDMSSYGAFEPIGNGWDWFENAEDEKQQNPFSGSYNGAGFEIANVTISDFGLRSVGIFSSSTGTLENINISNATIDITVTIPSVTVGIIAGIASEIKNCSVSGSINVDNIQSRAWVGGISGNGAYISDCINKANISVFGGDTNTRTIIECGGIAGVIGESISKCINKGNVSGYSSDELNIGGILGSGSNVAYSINYGNVFGTLTKCFSTSYNARVGGILGEAYGYISHCINLGVISGYAEYDHDKINSAMCSSGGIAGSISGASISNCYNKANINSVRYNQNLEKVFVECRRIVGDDMWLSGSLLDNYSTYDSLINGVVATEMIATNDWNGANISQEEFVEAEELIIREITPDTPTAPSTPTTYTRFGKYNGSTQKYVTDPTTGFGKNLMETVTIDGFTYNVADTCEQQSLHLPTDYLGNYYYIAYNLNESNEVSEAKIIPGTVCTLEDYDPATKVVDTDQFAPVVDGSTLPSGSYYVSDVTASSFPSDQIGAWIGDQIRVYCVGEQIFKVIHITEGKGEVTAYDKNNTPGVVLIDGVTYTVANDGVLRARISSPFENNSQYIKDAEFTMYDGTIVELDYVNEKLDPAGFNEYIYHAQTALDTNNDLYSTYQEYLHGKFSDVGTATQNTVDMCQESNFASLAKSWTTSTKIIDTLIEGPTGAMQYVTITQDDIYTAIILDSLECSYEINLSEKISSATKDLTSFYKLEIGGIKLSDVDMKLVNDEDSKKIAEKVLDELKITKGSADSSSFDDEGILDAFSTAFDFYDTIENYLEHCISYYLVRQLNDEMKQVVLEMYQECPNNNVHLKNALANCYTVLESTDAEFKKYVIVEGVKLAGGYTAKYLTDTVWSMAHEVVQTVFPVVRAVIYIYKAGKFLLTSLTNIDQTSEAYYKMLALLKYEDLARYVMDNYANEFKSLPNEALAKLYLESAKLNFQTLKIDVDYALAFWNAYNNSISTSVGELIYGYDIEETIQMFEKYYDIVETTRIRFDTHWIMQLDADYPELFEQYKDKLYDGFKKDPYIREQFSIACPVNVYVYNKDNECVAYIENEKVYSSEDISVVLEGDTKHFYIHDDNEYRVVCEGYGAGTMDVTVNQYAEDGTVKRIANYFDVSVNEHSIHNLDVDNIRLDDSQNIVNPSYDSEKFAHKYKVKIVNGFTTTNNTYENTITACEGEIIDISCYIPLGQTFYGWSSNNDKLTFNDATAISTSFTMIDSDVIINAGTSYVETPVITVDANGGVTGHTKIMVTEDGMMPSLPKATRNGYTFDGWYTDPVSGVKVTTSTVFTSDTTIYAHWIEQEVETSMNPSIIFLLLHLKAQTHTITATASEGGSITPSGGVEVGHGDDITYTITPNDGYYVASILVDGEPVEITDMYVFEKVKDEHEIIVTFQKKE